ncbi:MAG TPA: GNAT family N-acetyltransferase [Prosthecobacter sp.]
MHFTNLTHTDTALLESFYHGLYEAQFPDYNERESLENMRNYLRLKAEGWYGQNNYHILLGYEGTAEAPGELVAACVSDYFYLPNTGVIEFLLVAPETRGKGYGKGMLDEITRVFHADARRVGHAGADYVMGEMNDPFLTDPAEDNLDPFGRARIWGGWGYSALDFPYVQPALDEDKQAVENLLLMARPLNDAAATVAPAETVRQVVYDYLKWAMRFDDPTENEQYQGMARFLNERAVVRLLPLRAYVGEAADRPLSVLEVRGAAELAQMLPVYRANFGAKQDLAIDEGEFAALIAAPEQEWFRYHLWGLRSAEAGPVEGMASFFAFPWGGFGGYIALDGSLRGTRRLLPLLARMEREMLRDFPTAMGWLIECDPPGIENTIFEKAGFFRLPIDYRQPDLEAREGGMGVARLRPLNLLYKPFGRVYALRPPAAEEVLRAVADVFRAVYGIAEPEGTVAFRHLRGAGMTNDE